MKYKNAQDILPDKLLRELQQYISGGVLYVPSADTKNHGERFPAPGHIINSGMKKSGKSTGRDSQLKNWR